MRDREGRPRPRGGVGGHRWLVLGGRRVASRGARVHLAHPLGVKGWSYRRVKNDEVDAGGLADLLRMHRLPEAWIAPPAVRELRELVRHRAKLVALRSGLKAQVHAVLAKQGIAVPMSDLFGKAGMAMLADAPLDRVYRLRVASLVDLIDGFDYEVDCFPPAHRRTVAHRPWLPGVADHPRGGAGVRRRDRRRHPLFPSGEAGLVGGAAPSPPRVRHHRAPRSYVYPLWHLDHRLAPFEELMVIDYGEAVCPRDSSTSRMR